MIGRFLPWTAGRPLWNMAVDEALLTTYIQGTAPVTLRFTAGITALSLGYLQSLYRRPDKPVVDRPEWNSAPANGWTRCLPPTRDYIRFGYRGARRVLRFGLADYQRIGLGLQRGFALLGLPVDMVSGLRQGK